jgi:hypothetical protein
MKKIRAFNVEYPKYPIASETIRRSYRSRLSAAARNQGGAALNRRLNGYLRSTAGIGFYG